MPARDPRTRPKLPRRRPDRYGALLVMILVDCVAIFTASASGINRWLPGVLVAVTLILGLETSAVEGWWVSPARVLAVLAIVAAMADAAVGTKTTLAWVSLAQALLLVILVLAVICIYVLFGLIFALAEYGVSGLTDTQFFVQTDTPTVADFVYFSFVVLTTLGFGDLTPATDTGKAIVSFEALLGQIFLVTVVSRLVGLYSRDRPPPADDDSAGSTGGEPAAG
jgi:lysylphosphatidylglycerol synthetase-like protein (DUF2156 family)